MPRQLRFNPITGAFESYTPELELGAQPNGLVLQNNVLYLAPATEENPGAMSPEDYSRLYSIKTYEYFYEDVILTAQQIADRKITLSKMPVFPETLLFIPDGGTAQRYGEDYTVVGNEIRWSGLGLDNFLEVGETIRITYHFE
jgi:hypothetical protein